jgi:DNA-binding GntR family transcriptional regulator
VKSSKPLTAKVYDEVYSDIVNGRILPGDVITEGMLIKQHGVSKSPVREALIALCNEEILRAIPRLGYMVVPIMPQEIRELAEARMALEVFMLEKSFAMLGEAAISELEELILANREDAQIRRSPMDNWQRNMRFHLRLASFAGNKVMYELLEKVLRKLVRATTQHFRGYDANNPLLRERTSGARHFELVQACRERDLVLAKRVLEIDVNELRYSMEV